MREMNHKRENRRRIPVYDMRENCSNIRRRRSRDRKDRSDSLEEECILERNKRLKKKSNNKGKSELIASGGVLYRRGKGKVLDSKNLEEKIRSLSPERGLERTRMIERRLGIIQPLVRRGGPDISDRKMKTYLRSVSVENNCPPNVVEELKPTEKLARIEDIMEHLPRSRSSKVLGIDIGGSVNYDLEKAGALPE